MMLVPDRGILVFTISIGSPSRVKRRLRVCQLYVLSTVLVLNLVYPRMIAPRLWTVIGVECC